MAEKQLKVKIKHRVDSSANWTKNNPILLAGEIGIISDTNEFRIGDGTTRFNSLKSIFIDKSSIETLINSAVSSGIASGADKLTTARTISLSGDVTGSVSFDGSKDVTITSTVADNSHNHTISNVTNLQTELNKKANLDSPALTGVPTAPTATTSTNNTQIATTEYVNKAINSKLASSDALIYKGTIGTGGTITALPAEHTVGWTYRVITAGTYAGQNCEVGDLITCLTSGTTANNSHWTVVQTNIDGAVTGPTSSVTNHVVTFNGTSGRVIKDSGYTISSSVPANAKFTDTTYSAGDGLSLSGTTFSNTGVYSVEAGTTSDKLVVNTNGTSKTLTINQVENAKNADLATKASQDSTGQQIDTTYVKDLSVNGKVITFTKGDGSTSTITTQDTNTTYSAGDGISLSGTTFSNSGVRSVTAGTTADKLVVNTGGTSSTLTVNNVANAVSATKATQDGDGKVISSTYAKLSGAEFTGNVVFNKIHRDERYASNVCSYYANNTTPTEFVLKTRIEFRHQAYMPVIRLYGFAYGLHSPIELRVGLYVLDYKFEARGVSCAGAWKPDVYLFTYTENNIKYIAVGLKGKCYFPGFQIDAQNPTRGEFNNGFNLDGWSVLDNGSDTSQTLIPAVGTNDCVSVEYKTMKTDIEGSATKLSTARTISLTGDVTGSTSFDGSNNVSITATVADNSHNHTISNVTGLQSALDGKASTSTATTSTSGLMSSTDKAKLDGIAANANNYSLPTASTTTLGGVKVDGTSITISNGVISSPNQTTITGNAGSATKLQNARTITLSGDVTGSVSFDGSKDVTITSTVADNSHSHTIANVTNLQTTLDSKASKDTATTTTAGLMSSTDKTKLDGIESGANKYSLPTASTTVLGGVKVDGTSIKITDGVISSPNQTTISGNAGSATKLQTARTISLSGGATGSVSFDGSANATINVTVTNNSHSHTIANVTNLQTTLDTKAPLASPALTGKPTAPTATVGTSNTQIATTEFVSAAINNKLADAAELMKFKGTLGTNGTVTELPATHNVGWSYKVATAGTYAGNACEIGDLIICIENGTTANDSHWTVVQTNIDGAVTGPTSSVANRIAAFNGTSGKVIKDSGFTIATSVPANAKFTDTVYTHPTSGVTAGTYRSVTVDAQGHVTAGTNPTTLSGYGITDAAPKNSPALTGAPTAPTADAGTNTTQIATTAFVNTAISNKTTITGNAGSATKLQTARTISLEGDVTGSVSFDGSKNVDITTAVADDSHNHSISTVTGLQNALDGKASTAVVTTTASGLMSADDKKKLDGIATGANNYSLPTASTSTLGGVKVDGSTITISNGVISSPNQTTITGNAGSATKLATARTIQTNLSSTSTASFDGTENVTPGVTGTLPVSNGGTGKTTAKDAANSFISSLDSGEDSEVINDDMLLITHDSDVDSDNWVKRKASILWAYIKDKISSVLGLTSSSYGGNSATATKLATSRSISLTGDATGSASFDGSTNASISTTLANSGVTAGTYGPTAAATLSYGGSVNVPKVVVDAKGRVTSAAHYAIKLPAAPTTITGNAGSASKVNNSLTLKVKTGTTEGTDLYTFDGSSAKTLDIKQGSNVTLTAASGSLTIAAKDTTYSAGTGISLSGTKISNSGVLSVTAGTSADQLSVNTGGTTTTITVNNVANATSSTSATQDSAGQQIDSTYIKGLSVSGKVITYTRGDDTTGTITTQDTNTTYSAMTGATASAAGTTGLVPAPAAGKQTSFLRGDGTWVIPTNTDTKVTQTISTTDADYPLLAAATANKTATSTEASVFASAVKLNPSTGNITATKFTGALVGNVTGNADTATKATQDSTGQQINTTYIKGLSVSGKTITYTKGDGKTATIITQDTTYSTGNASTAGITKLYTTTGDGTDGTMTQSAITSALNAKAPLASPSLTGTPTAPTAAASTNNTQIATTAYVNTVVNNKIAAADAMIYKGTIGTSGTVTALPATHSTGWTYKVITAGTYAGQKCEVGDMIVCLTDGTTATDSHWTVIQTNIDGAVTGPASAVSGRIATFDGTTGKLIKDSGYTIATSVPSGAKFTDTTYSAGTGISLSGTQISNSGVHSISSGSTNGTISVNTGGTSAEVAVKGLGSAAYTESSAYAAASHGTHVTYATANPSANGTAAVGTSTKVAREDHVHPLQTTVSGNAGSATKVNNSLVLKLKSGTTEGTDLYTFNGSAAKTLDIKQGTNVTLTAAAGSLTIAAKDTTYSAGDGLSLSGTSFSNSGVRSITAGSSANQLSVNTGGTTTTITVNNVASATAAGKLSTARSIDGVSFNGTANIVHYGTCSTEAATAAKVVSITGFTLVTGAEATVKFTVTNTAASPTLNINSTGAKAIQYRGAAITAGYLAANRTYRFVYDGTNYQLIGDINTDTNTDTKVTQTVTTTNAEYSLLAMADAAATANKTNSARFSTGATLNPSTNTITATTFKGQATNLTDAKLAEILCLSF